MKFLNIFNTDTLKKNIQVVFYRFPVSVLIICLTSILFFIELHHESVFDDVVNQNFVIAILSLILVFFMSVGVYLTCENNDVSKIKKNVFQLIPVIFGIGFFFTFTNDINNFENIVLFFLSLFGMISYLFFAPYLLNIFSPFLKNIVGKKHGGMNIKQGVFYAYFYDISVIILLTLILGGVMYSLGAIAILSIDVLFEINMYNSKIYGYWAIFSLSLVAPFFALTQVPEKSEFRKKQFKENLFFSFLIKFVALPFIVVYFLILYTYTFKVLAHFTDWPKGEITWMVIGFSIFGYITYIFSYIFEKKNMFIKKFRTIFPYVVIPQIFMLFYAIYLRIHQYDVTINRYLVVTFGLWLLVISLYYIVSKKKRLLFLPTILTLFTVIISIGPWGIYSLPEHSQLERLKSNLLKANIGQNAASALNDKNFITHILPLEAYSDISYKLSANIYSGITYLCDFDDCNNIKKLFPEIYSQLKIESKIEWEKNRKEDIERMRLQTSFDEYYTKEDNLKEIQKTIEGVYVGLSKWEIINGITKKIKVSDYYGNHELEKDSPIISFYDNNKQYSQYPLNIEGYDYLTVLRDYLYDGSEFEEDLNKYVFFDMKQKQIRLIVDGEEIETTSIGDLFTQFYNNKSRDTGGRHHLLKKEELTFILEGKKYLYKMIIDNIELPNLDYDINLMSGEVKVRPIGNVSGIVLIKEK